MKSHLRIAEWLAHALDDQFKLGPLRFGFDPIIGLFPLIGDIFTTLLSLYIVWIGIGLKLPKDKIAQMLKNVFIDFLLDFIPVLGQIFDFAFKANTKNLAIIKKYAPDYIEGEVIR